MLRPGSPGDQPGGSTSKPLWQARRSTGDQSGGISSFQDRAAEETQTATAAATEAAAAKKAANAAAKAAAEAKKAANAAAEAEKNESTTMRTRSCGSSRRPCQPSST